MLPHLSLEQPRLNSGGGVRRNLSATYNIVLKSFPRPNGLNDKHEREEQHPTGDLNDSQRVNGLMIPDRLNTRDSQPHS